MSRKLDSHQVSQSGRLLDVGLLLFDKVPPSLEMACLTRHRLKSPGWKVLDLNYSGVIVLSDLLLICCYQKVGFILNLL